MSKVSPRVLTVCWMFDDDIPGDGYPEKAPGLYENHSTFVSCTQRAQELEKLNELLYTAD